MSETPKPKITLPFENRDEEEFLNYSDSLLRLIKHVKTAEVLYGKPVLDCCFEKTDLPVHECLNTIYIETIGGVQPKEFWDYFVTLLEKREDGSYYLNRSSLEVYHSLCETLWEHLDRTTREYLVSGHGLPVQQLIGLKPFTMQTDDQLEDFIRTNRSKYIGGKDLHKHLENPSGFESKDFQMFLEEHSCEMGVYDSFTQRKKLKEKLNITKLFREYLRGLSEEIPVARGQLRPIFKKMKILDKIKHYSFLATNTPFSVQNFYDAARFITSIEDDEVLPNHIRLLLSKSKDRYNTLVKLKEKKRVRKKDLRKIKYLERTITKNANQINYRLKKSVEQRTKRLLERNTVIGDKINSDIKTVEGYISTKLNEIRETLEKEVPVAEKNLYRGLALYAYRFNMRSLEKFGKEYKCEANEYNSELLKVQEVQGGIGLVDLCPVFIEKHIGTLREGDLMNICYIPLDLRGHVSIAFSAHRKAMTINIKPGSEYCGIESLDDRHMLENLMLLGLGRQQNLDIVDFICKLRDKEENFLMTTRHEPTWEELQEQVFTVDFKDRFNLSQRHPIPSNFKKAFHEEIEEIKVAYLIAKSKMMNVNVKYDRLRKALDDSLQIRYMLYGNDERGNWDTVGMEILRDDGESLDILFNTERGDVLDRDITQKFYHILNKKDSG